MWNCLGQKWSDLRQSTIMFTCVRKRWRPTVGTQDRVHTDDGRPWRREDFSAAGIWTAPLILSVCHRHHVVVLTSIRLDVSPLCPRRHYGLFAFTSQRIYSSNFQQETKRVMSSYTTSDGVFADFAAVCSRRTFGTCWHFQWSLVYSGSDSSCRTQSELPSRQPSLGPSVKGTLTHWGSLLCSRLHAHQGGLLDKSSERFSLCCHLGLLSKQKNKLTSWFKNKENLLWQQIDLRSTGTKPALFLTSHQFVLLWPLYWKTRKTKVWRLLHHAIVSFNF